MHDRIWGNPNLSESLSATKLGASPPETLRIMRGLRPLKLPLYVNGALANSALANSALANGALANGALGPEGRRRRRRRRKNLFTTTSPSPIMHRDPISRSASPSLRQILPASADRSDVIFN